MLRNQSVRSMPGGAVGRASTRKSSVNTKAIPRWLTLVFIVSVDKSRSMRSMPITKSRPSRRAIRVEAVMPGSPVVKKVYGSVHCTVFVSIIAASYQARLRGS